MFRNAYISMNEQILPEKILIEKTINKINAKKRTPIFKLIPRYCRVGAVAAALVICVIMTMPVLAANVPTIYNLMYLVSPSTAQFFMPVQKTSNSNGVRMEVLSTYIHDDTAEIYVTMQDITGNRIDATTDLYDSYSINRPFDSSGYCEFVGYDEETKTATFLIKITEWGNRNIEGEKITFTVRCFISNKRSYKDMFLDIPLDNLTDNARTKEVDFIGGGGDFDFMANDTATVLDVTGSLLTPIDGIDITGIGYVNGKLHVQVSIEKDLKSDNHGYVFLKDKDGEIIRSDYAICFGEYLDSRDSAQMIHHYNYVFSVPQNEINRFSLYGTFSISGRYTEGDWRVTFPLVASKET